MAKKNVPADAPDSVLMTAAKSIGAAAGKIAAAVGVSAPVEPKAPRTRRPKLAKKNKARLPRRQKKAVQKAKESASASE